MKETEKNVDKEEQEKEVKQFNQNKKGWGIGFCLGIIFGAFWHNIALGLLFGVAIGGLINKFKKT